MMPIDIESLVADDDTALKRVFKSDYCIALDYDINNLSESAIKKLNECCTRFAFVMPFGW